MALEERQHVSSRSVALVIVAVSVFATMMIMASRSSRRKLENASEESRTSQSGISNVVHETDSSEQREPAVAEIVALPASEPARIAALCEQWIVFLRSA